jgi:pyoluteorin transport system ATP-binding protein
VATALRIHDLELPGRQVVSRPVSLEVRLGEVVGIVGRAGVGKSLLLHILSGQRPGQGRTLEVLGLDLRREPRRVWENVGFASGWRDSLLDWRSAADNLKLEARQKGLPAARLDEVVRLQLEEHGLDQTAETVTAVLDRESRFRLGLAAATVAQPHLLFLDEPLLGADAASAERLLAALYHWLDEDASHTLVVAGESLTPFGQLLTALWRLDERGLVPAPLPDPQRDPRRHAPMP